MRNFLSSSRPKGKEIVVRINALSSEWGTEDLLAARAGGLDMLDGVYNDFRDADGFAAECAAARDMGFDGKTLIHPSQVEPANAAFSPTAGEVAEARAIVAAFALEKNKGKGVIKLDGRMVERLHFVQAERTLARAAVSRD
jgi:citrate lyase subunit beta/citryl-CoA lyase